MNFIFSKRLKTALLLVFVVAFGAFSYKCIHKSIERTDSYVFYRAGRAIIEGEPLYDASQWRAFSNPPFLALLMVPFSALGLVGFSVVWYFFNVGLLVGTLLLSVYLVRGRLRPASIPLILLPLLMTLRPIESNFTLGQCNLLVIFFTVAGLALFRRGHPFFGGVSIASAVWIKLTPGLFLPYFIYKKRWKMAAGIVAGAALFGLVLPSLVFGPTGAFQELINWWELTSTIRLQPTPEGLYVPGQTLRTFMVRLLTTSSIESGPELKYINVVALNPEIVQFLVYGVSGLMLGTMAWNFRRRAESASVLETVEFALVALTMTMLSPFSRKAHYVSMVFPAMVAAYYLMERGRELKGKLELGRLPAVIVVSTIALVTLPSRDLLGERLSDYVNGVGSIFLGATVMWVGLNAILFKERTALAEGRIPLAYKGEDAN